MLFDRKEGRLWAEKDKTQLLPIGSFIEKCDDFKYSPCQSYAHLTASILLHISIPWPLPTETRAEILQIHG